MGTSFLSRLSVPETDLLLVYTGFTVAAVSGVDREHKRKWFSCKYQVSHTQSKRDTAPRRNRACWLEKVARLTTRLSCFLYFFLNTQHYMVFLRTPSSGMVVILYWLALLGWKAICLQEKQNKTKQGEGKSSCPCSCHGCKIPGSKVGLVVMIVTQQILTRQTVDRFICILMCRALSMARTLGPT